MNVTQKGRALDHIKFLIDVFRVYMCNQGEGSALSKMSCCVVMRTIHAVVHLVGRGASFLIGKSVWVDGEAEA